MMLRTLVALTIVAAVSGFSTVGVSRGLLHHQPATTRTSTPKQTQPIVMFASIPKPDDDFATSNESAASEQRDTSSTRSPSATEKKQVPVMVVQASVVVALGVLVYSIVGGELAKEFATVIGHVLEFAWAALTALLQAVKVIAPVVGEAGRVIAPVVGQAAVAGYSTVAPVVQEAYTTVAQPVLEEATAQLATAAQPYVDSAAVAVDSTLQQASETVMQATQNAVQAAAPVVQEATGKMTDSLQQVMQQANLSQ